MEHGSTAFAACRGDARRVCTKNLRVVPAGLAHVQELLESGVRTNDVKEAFKVTGLPFEQALMFTMQNASMAGAVYNQGQLVVLFGVNASSLLPSHGIPWMVGHKSMEDNTLAVPLARIAKRFIDQWAGVFGRLENVADPSHEKALCFLQFMGFTLDHTTMVRGPLGHALIRFWR